MEGVSYDGPTSPDMLFIKGLFLNFSSSSTPPMQPDITRGILGLSCSLGVRWWGWGCGLVPQAPCFGKAQPSFGSLSLGPLFHPKFLWISPRRKLVLGSGGLCSAIDLFLMIREHKENLFFSRNELMSLQHNLHWKDETGCFSYWWNQKDTWLCLSNLLRLLFFRSETNVAAVKNLSCVIQICCLGVDQHVTWPSNGSCEYLRIIETSYRYYVVSQSIDQNTSGTKPIIEFFSHISQALCDIKREQ